MLHKYSYFLDILHKFKYYYIKIAVFLKVHRFNFRTMVGLIIPDIQTFEV
jgi:hypothetical protein